MLHNLQSTEWEFVPCIAFYGDFNMTHGDLCSVKYMSVVNCFVIMFWEKKIMSWWMEVFVESFYLRVLKF